MEEVKPKGKNLIYNFHLKSYQILSKLVQPAIRLWRNKHRLSQTYALSLKSLRFYIETRKKMKTVNIS